jgi:transcriptional regulator GlxA family with amidase domain
MAQQTVGILIFDDVEVLDFCGPFEVFATTQTPGQDGQDDTARPFNVITIAERAATVRCRGGLLVQPHHTIDDHPLLDILVVPGGWGTRREVHNDRLLDWIAAQDQQTMLTTSVCTGAFLLAARGLLDGRQATTHWASIERLRQTHPAIEVRDDRRWVDSDRIITSAGVSAGIDMALHVVARLLGVEVAQETARRMEYEGASAEY